MAQMASCLLVVLLMLVAVQCSLLEEYRYDYELSEEADGWLKFHEIPATWSEARIRCHAEGAVLASPLTDNLKSAIISLVKKQKGSNFEDEFTIFTGVHATFSKGVYSSIEGVPLLKLTVTWAPGEPDNYQNAESCLVMRVHSGSMADAQCEKLLPYVCYKRVTFGLSFTQCGTTDSEYVMNINTMSCYKFHKRALVWSEAYMTCAAEGGYLAIINNDLEAQVVQNIFAEHPSSTIHSTYPDSLLIGFHDWGFNQNFMTIHGETLNAAGYDKWSGGQPNNITMPDIGGYGQFCGSFEREGGLNDHFCTVPMAFLCEMTPNSLQ